MASWQTRPVFVSSTLRDIQSERDWLREPVIPELEERLRARRARLEVVDLRWGVETISAGEEAAKELLVLKVCLEEIERCRPFLIVLLGDRYGWVPDPERMRAAVAEAGFETEVEGKSVTALEIEYGVLADPTQRRRTRFYFRAPLPYDRMPPDVAAQFSEQHSPEPGAAEAHGRLQALRSRIETDPTWSDRVRHYSAQWDGQTQRVAGLKAFGAMVSGDDQPEQVGTIAVAVESTGRITGNFELEYLEEDTGESEKALQYDALEALAAGRSGIRATCEQSSGTAGKFDASKQVYPFKAEGAGSVELADDDGWLQPESTQATTSGTINDRGRMEGTLKVGSWEFTWAAR